MSYYNEHNMNITQINNNYYMITLVNHPALQMQGSKLWHECHNICTNLKVRNCYI
ncbi:MAG: hypothetical protein O7D30_01220 [Rickettsia endosymbiont of Ixodes persulcatus]|nr:hypothetical protein [Rickettsia endosymbiont of Ixodes persulcatus]